MADPASHWWGILYVATLIHTQIITKELIHNVSPRKRDMQQLIYRLCIIALIAVPTTLHAQSATLDSIAWYKNKLTTQNSPEKKAMLQSKLAWFLSSNGDTDQAIELALAAIDVFTETRNYYELHKAYVTLGQVFQFQHNLPKAVHYAEKALADAILSKRREDIVNAYQSYGMVLGENKQYDASLAALTKALDMAVASRDTLNTMLTQLNAASILVEKGDYTKTIHYAQSGLAIAEKLGNEEAVFRAEAIIGAALTKQRRFAEADAYFRFAEQHLPAIGSVFYDREMALIRTEWAERQDNFAAAYRYQKAYYTLDTLLANQQNKQKVAELETRFRTKEKDLENSNLQSEVAYQRWLFVVLFVVFVLLCLVFYLRHKQLVNRNELPRTQKRLATSQLITISNQLTVFADSVSEKNALIDAVKAELDTLKVKDADLSHTLTAQLNQARMLTDAQWNDFRLKFEQLNPQFISRLHQQVPHLTNTETQMACMIRLNFSTKQMAGMLGISAESVTKNRYRLRKKICSDDIKSYIAAI